MKIIDFLTGTLPAVRPPRAKSNAAEAQDPLIEVSSILTVCNSQPRASYSSDNREPALVVLRPQAWRQIVAQDGNSVPPETSSNVQGIAISSKKAGTVVSKMKVSTPTQSTTTGLQETRVFGQVPISLLRDGPLYPH